MNERLTFGEKLRELRIKEGLTQAQVAKRINVASQTYSRWELDERHPSYDLLAELLYVLGNVEFKILNKEVKIGDDVMKPNRKYLEIPAYAEVVAQYQHIETLTHGVKTLDDVYKFAEAHPTMEIEINGWALDEVDATDELEWVRFEYRNILFYKDWDEELECLETRTSFTLYDDEGTQLDDCEYLNEVAYCREIDRCAMLDDSLTPNPDYKPISNLH